MKLLNSDCVTFGLGMMPQSEMILHGRRRQMRMVGAVSRSGGGAAAELRVVTLFRVPHEMIFAAEPLLTKWTRKVTRARVHHQMSLYIFAREEHTVALVALESPFGRRPLRRAHC